METKQFGEFEIGEMREEDLEFLPELCRQYFIEDEECKTNVKKMYNNFNKYKNNDFWHFVVMRHGKKTIGYAEVFVHPSILLNQEPYISIWWVRIEKQYRNKGLGTKMIQYIEDYGKKIGADSCCLIADVANEGAQRLYERLGYEKDVGYYKDLTK